MAERRGQVSGLHSCIFCETYSFVSKSSGASFPSLTSWLATDEQSVFFLNFGWGGVMGFFFNIFIYLFGCAGY